MSIAALFIIANRWKYPKCPSNDTRIRNKHGLSIWRIIILQHFLQRSIYSDPLFLTLNCLSRCYWVSQKSLIRATIAIFFFTQVVGHLLTYRYHLQHRYFSYWQGPIHPFFPPLASCVFCVVKPLPYPRSESLALHSIETYFSCTLWVTRFCLLALQKHWAIMYFHLQTQVPH